MELNEITEHRDNLIRKINDMIVKEELAYNKLVKKNFIKRIINSQELLEIKNKLSSLDLLKRFIEGESFSLRQLITIASDNSLMMNEDFKNVVYSIRNKLNDVRGHSNEINNQTLLDNYIYIEELSLDLEKERFKK